MKKICLILIFLLPITTNATVQESLIFLFSILLKYDRLTPGHALHINTAIKKIKNGYMLTQEDMGLAEPKNKQKMFIEISKKAKKVLEQSINLLPGARIYRTYLQGQYELKQNPGDEDFVVRDRTNKVEKVVALVDNGIVDLIEFLDIESFSSRLEKTDKNKFDRIKKQDRLKKEQIEYIIREILVLSLPKKSPLKEFEEDIGILSLVVQ